MSDFARAIDLVRKAENGLRDLMRQALDQQHYRELAEIAPLADTLADLVRRSPTEPVSPNNSTRPASGLQSVGRPPSVKPQSRATAREEYPRFERDGDKLVKIAWSKKDKKEYEHRTPREAVFRVAELIAAGVKPGRPFRMDKLIPFKDTAGNEIPSYQAYLALAWFRKLGAVEERGKDGYALVDGGLDAARLSEHWHRL